jgi:phage repressor protein C with HTH and peptisase S24 domain
MEARQAALLSRIDEKLEQHGLNDSQASTMAVGKPDLIRDLRRKKGMPGAERLRQLARVLGTTTDWLLTGAGDPSAPEPAEPSRSAVDDPFATFRGDRPRDVPVRGTPSCGDVEIDGQNIETIDMDLDEVVDWVRRPATLDSRRDVYAIYPQGFSMAPRFEPGEVAYVDTRKPPSIGDYVVVQLRKARGDEDGDRVVSALLKRLVRQSADWVELEQFNPAATFRVERRRIAAIHRIFPWAELVGI